MPVDAAVAEIVTSSPLFEATRAPYLVLDRELRIAAVNAAYEAVTGLPREMVVGQPMFEAFPANPADPASAAGVERLTASFEHVLRRGRRHYPGVLRHDIPDAADKRRFIVKMWAPVNSAINDAGQTVGVLHHAEDVTDLLAPVDEERHAADVDDVADRWLRLTAAARAARVAAAAKQAEVEQLRQALDTNRQISMAIGLLVARYEVPQSDAFRLLQRLASRQHRKLHDVAVELVQAATSEC